MSMIILIGRRAPQHQIKIMASPVSELTQSRILQQPLTDLED